MIGVVVGVRLCLAVCMLGQLGGQDVMWLYLDIFFVFRLIFYAFQLLEDDPIFLHYFLQYG